MGALRLAILMIAGAFVGQFMFGVGIGDRTSEVEKDLPAALFGPGCGFAIELFLRAGQPREKIAWRFSIRDALLMVAIAAIGLWIIIALWHSRNPKY
jgi:hypothetical protein